jgi:hypothetical protein
MGKFIDFVEKGQELRAHVQNDQKLNKASMS